MVTYNNAEALTGLNSEQQGSALRNAETGAALVLDVDGLWMRGFVFDAVESEMRLVASAQAMSTIGLPIGDLSVAARDVISDLEAQTGMQLSGLGEAELRAVTVTGYPVRPIRVAIIPTGDHRLATMLRMAGQATPAVMRVLNEQIRTEDGVLSATLLESFLRIYRPDVAILLEGDRARSEWASAVGAIGGLLDDGSIEQLIVLAAEEYQEQLIQVVGDDGSITGLDPGQYETYEVATALEAELAGIYEQQASTLPHTGVERTPGFVRRQRGGDLATRYIARHREKTVVSVDVSTGVGINWSTLSAGGSHAILDVDLHEGIRSVLSLDLPGIVAELPIDMSREELANWILNRATRPRVVADLWRDQVIESALLSAVTVRAWEELREVSGDQIDLLIAGPGFCYEADPTLGVLALLDAFRPAPLGGITQIVLDADGLLWAAGAVGESHPAVAADVIEHDLLITAATVVVVEGHGEVGEVALSGKLTYETGEPIEFTVAFGSFERLPLGEGERATLLLTCSPGFAVGGSNPGEQVHLGPENGLTGGDVGLIMDARGRNGSSARTGKPTGNWFAELGIEIP